MVLFVGQVGRDYRGREAFQEIDVAAMFGSTTKWATEIDSAERIPEMLNRAFHTACVGRPGPVVLGIPEDMLRERAAVADAGPFRLGRPVPDGDAMVAFRRLLAAAERPFLLVGGGGWDATAAADIVAFAEAFALPAGASFRCQDLFDNDHPCYAGDVGLGINPALAARIAAADLLIVVGARLGEATTQTYTLPTPPRPRQTLVHVHPGAEEIGRVYRPDLAIAVSPGAFAAAARTVSPLDAAPWSAWTTEARRDYLAWIEPGPIPGALDLGAIVAELHERLAPEAIVCTDGGNFAAWGHRFYRYSRFRSQLGPTCGAMGYGVPAAIAAKLAEPERPVICLVGDGGALMTGQEIATALRHGVAPVILLVNNGIYGTIRMHQERSYPGRTIATDLVNPDFAAWARSFGAHGETIERTQDFAPALERALDAGRCAVIELRLDPEAITPRTTLSAIREDAQAKRGRGKNA